MNHAKELKKEELKIEEPKKDEKVKGIEKIEEQQKVVETTSNP